MTTSVLAPASARCGASAPSRRTAALLALAAAALLFGLAVYLVDRPSAHALWIPAIGSPAAGRHLGAAGDWLPSFLHVLAFSLLTAAVLSGGAGPACAACAGWALLDIVFELAQHERLKVPLAAALRGGDLTEPLARYVLRGTYDGRDLAAALAGALCAAAVILLLDRGRRPQGART